MNSPALNILCNGGPVVNAERIIQLVSMHHALFNFPRGEIHISFSVERFEHDQHDYGIRPRNGLEAMVWEELQPLIYREAMEVFLRLLRGDILRSENLIPCVLSSKQVADQTKWLTLIHTLKNREQMRTLDEEDKDIEKVKEKLIWCMDVRRIDDYQVQFPFRFVYPKQHIGVISKPLDTSCLRLSLVSHNLFLQQVASCSSGKSVDHSSKNH